MEEKKGNYLFIYLFFGLFSSGRMKRQFKQRTFENHNRLLARLTHNLADTEIHVKMSKLSKFQDFIYVYAVRRENDICHFR